MSYAGPVATRSDAAATRSLSERAYQELRRRILYCELEPGELISERGIAAEIDLGIAAVRSALVRLSAEGLVTTIPRVGYQVSSFTIEYINQFFETWRILGRAIVRLSHARMTEADRSRIHALREENRGGDPADPEAVIVNTDRLWEEMVATARNPLLQDFFARMEVDMRRLFILALRADHDRQGITAQMLAAPGTNEADTVEDGLARFDAFVDMSQRYIMRVIVGLPALSRVSLDFV